MVRVVRKEWFCCICQEELFYNNYSSFCVSVGTFINLWCHALKHHGMILLLFKFNNVSREKISIKSKFLFWVSDCHNMLFSNCHKVEKIKLNHTVLFCIICKRFVNIKPPKNCQQTIQIYAQNLKREEGMTLVSWSSWMWYQK